MEMERKIKIPEHLNKDKSGVLKVGETTVKNLDLKKTRPSIFIGSATESYTIAKKIASFFDKDKFEVDPWKMDIFGQKDKEGNSLSNAEQLKNFTDIYDYAIFVFTPDDRLVSQTRKDLNDGSLIEAHSVRHNVVFEFGIFLGRIGAERSFILYEDIISDFINFFFTDLAENIQDNDDASESRFKIESHSYKGNYLKYIESGKDIDAFDSEDLEKKVNLIENKIKGLEEEISISFLPSTSLAKGYANNFLNRVLDRVAELKGIYIPENKDWSDDKPIPLDAILKKKKTIEFNVVIPDSLAMTLYKDFKDIFKDSFFAYGAISTKGGRPLTVYCSKKSMDATSNKLVIYDIPSTMNSSIEAIKMTTNHEDIIELLSEKERRNFDKVLGIVLDGKPYYKIISWDEFKDETGLRL